MNNDTDGIRTEDTVATVIGYAKVIEGSALSTADKIKVFRAVLDPYQPTAEESTSARATTQAEIDKKDPTPTERFTAQESFVPTTGEAIAPREPVQGFQHLPFYGTI